VPDDKLDTVTPFATARSAAVEASTPVSEASRVAPRARSDTRAAARSRDLRLMILAALSLTAAIAIARAGQWTAGSDFGYWLGVAAGAAMFMLLTYPLRKRMRFAQRLGRMRGWFALHMVLGIATPLLVILHSRLAFGSVNATVAFAVMALVAGSGFVGRFLYARIHHGLYGEKASLAQLRHAANDEASAVHAQLAIVPEVVARLDAFSTRAETVGREGMRHPLRFVALGLESLAVRLRCRARLRRGLVEQAQGEGWDAPRLARRVTRRRELVDRYVATTLRVAQFAVFERLFSWWHVLHVPLVWLLVASVVAHVVAVHMY
jgi:hypothetical protein